MLGTMSASDRSMRDRVRLLYEGRSKRATRFRYALLIFDAVTIIFFLATATMPLGPGLIVADAGIAVIILADFVCRLWIAENRLRHLRQVYVIIDVLVLASLIAAPFLGLGCAAVVAGAAAGAFVSPAQGPAARCAGLSVARGCDCRGGQSAGVHLCDDGAGAGAARWAGAGAKHLC